MDDFASYTGGAAGGGGKSTDDWTREAQKIASTYNGRNESDLVREIYSRAAEGKRNGTLTNEQIDYFYAQFSPMLDGGKRKRLKKLVEQLKRT